MLYNLLNPRFTYKTIVLIASIVAFISTFILMAKPFGFLPRDGGKFVTDKDGNKVEVNEASSGKVTGVGMVFIPIFILLSILFVIPAAEYKSRAGIEAVIYLGLILIMSIVGYLDDSAKSPWGELIKGILDFVLALVAAVVFVIYNSSEISFLKWSFNLPKWFYVILAVALIWGSINVTNCSDGVDGLCGTVTVIELLGFMYIFGKNMPIYSAMACILAFVLVAYLSYNWNPSTVLMGDAGSRAIGFLLALLAMKSGHPFAFIILFAETSFITKPLYIFSKKLSSSLTFFGFELLNINLAFFKSNL